MFSFTCFVALQLVISSFCKNDETRMSNEVFSVKKEAKKNKQTNNSEKRKKRKICKNNTTTATKTETDNKTNTCSYRRCLVKISVLKNFTKFT